LRDATLLGTDETIGACGEAAVTGSCRLQTLADDAGGREHRSVSVGGVELTCVLGNGGQDDRRKAMAVDFELELMWIPVSDVDRAKRFYLEQAGFDLLVDIPNGLPGQRIVQVTPPGSACSIGFGDGGNPAKPGSQQGLFVVADVVAARDELAARGVKVGEVQHIIIGRSPGLQVLARAARLTSEISASFRTIASAGANAG
jgi:catechol 2,3-dioxygenase-like lactoylglutathione lyase family enzyme